MVTTTTIQWCSMPTQIDHVGRPSWQVSDQVHYTKNNNKTIQAQIRGKKRWFLEPPLECYTECADHAVDVDHGHISK